MRAGVCPSQAEFAATWALDRRFTPGMAEDIRAARYGRWRRAIAATIGV
jgi:glycerol kinase